MAQPDAGYRFVEITDLGDECDNDSAGADVDAVGALNGRLLSTEAIARATPHSKNPQGPGPLDDLHRVAEAFRQNEGATFPLQIAMRGQGWTLLEPQHSYTVQTDRVLRADVNADNVREAIFISTRRESQRVEHELDVYTERHGRVIPVAQAVVASGDAAPDASSLHARGAQISFVLSGAPVTYELRNSSLIPLR